MDDRVAIVTGAAGGVGRATVEALRQRGFRVVAVDISPAVNELAEPQSIAPLVADVRDTNSAAQTVAVAEREFGRLDLLVNNAGRFLRKPIGESTDDDFDELFAINVRSAFAFTRAALPQLIAAGGCIVNVASSSGLVGVTEQSIYAMTKGALVQLTRQQAIEQAPNGVRVNAVAPGAIDTEFTAAARALDPDPERSAAISLARHPLGRYSTADEVASAIAFLASASGVTGAILSVDGGYLAQ